MKTKEARKKALALETQLRRLSVQRLALMSKCAALAEKIVELAAEVPEDERFKLHSVLYDASDIGHRESKEFHAALQRFPDRNQGGSR